MEKMIDDLGRIVIPKDMRRKLKLDNGSIVNIELVEGSIVLTNPEEIDYKAIIKEAIEDLKFNQYKAYEEGNDVEYDKFQTTIDILSKGLK